MSGTHSIAPARRAAFELLLQMRHNPALHSDVLLHGRRVQPLSSLDKNLVTTLVMGVLRWQLVLAQRVQSFLVKKSTRLEDPVQIALELGALQLLALDRIPAHAAIFESVELARESGHDYAAGMVNAVLRKVSQTPKLTAANANQAHPDWMVARWVQAYGAQTTSLICAYDQEPPPVTIRLTTEAAEEGLLRQGVQLENVSFVERARKVVAGDISSMHAWRTQDEGSQLIAELAGRGTAILDCCAAPGGKTAILAERNPDAQILACDISPQRLKAMQKNLGSVPVRYQQVDATQLPFDREFDLVLCDAPCSGTGTLARNPEIRHRVTMEEFTRQRDRQVRLLQSAMRALRVGGRLVYSTCSLEKEENEDVVREALGGSTAFSLQPWRLPVRTLEEEGVLRAGSADRLFPEGAPDTFLQTYPGAYPGDGFFAACLTRAG